MEAEGQPLRLLMGWQEGWWSSLTTMWRVVSVSPWRGLLGGKALVPRRKNSTSAPFPGGGNGHIEAPWEFAL